MNKKVPFLAGVFAVICALLGVALFNVSTPATAHADSPAITIYEKWDPLNGYEFSMVRTSLLDNDYMFGSLGETYDVSLVSDWNDAIKFYSSSMAPIDDNTSLADRGGETIYVELDLPADTDNGYSAVSGQFPVYIRQYISAQLMIDDCEFGTIEVGYTGYDMDVRAQLKSGGADLNDDNVGVELVWSYDGSVDPVSVVREVGSYRDPIVTLTGSNMDNYWLDVMSYNTAQITVSPRQLYIEASKYFDAQVSHPIGYELTTDESNNGLDPVVFIPTLDYVELDNGRDYISAGYSYSIKAIIPEEYRDNYYFFVSGEVKYEETGSYDINKGWSAVIISLKEGAHWYYGNIVVLADGTVVEVDFNNPSTVAAAMDVEIDSVSPFEEDFEDSRFTWTYVPSGNDIGDDLPDNKVVLEYLGSDNFEADPSIFCMINVEPAPIYARDTWGEDREYTGSAQRPAKDELQLYIYTVANDYKVEAFLGEDSEDCISSTAGISGRINAGAYAITSGISLNETLLDSKLDTFAYEMVYDDGCVFTIQKAQLVVDLLNEKQYGSVQYTYGDELPTFLLSYTGFVNGEDVDAFFNIVGNERPNAEVNYERYQDIGENNYTITISGGEAINYYFTFANSGEHGFTVNSRHVTITTQNGGSVYGEAINDFIAIADGLVNNDNIYTLVCYEENTTEGDNLTPISSTTASDYYRIYVVMNTTGKVSNYSYATQNNGMYHITNATLTGVSVAQDQDLIYTAAAQSAHVSTAATAVNDQEVTFTYCLTADGSFTTAVPAVGPNVGKYTVYYNVEAANHDILPGSFTVEIEKALLTITADDKNVQYGNEAPEFTVAYSGFVGGENASDLGGTLAYACDYVKVSHHANTGHTITPSGLTSDNYDIHFENGTLTVVARDVTVTYTGEAKQVTYYDGDAFEALLAEMTEDNFYYLSAALVGDDELGNSYLIITFEDGEHVDVTDALMLGELAVGTYYMVVTDRSAGDDYAFTSSLGANAYLEIVNANFAAYSAAQNGALTYNGAEQTATVVTSATAVDGEEAAFTYSTAENGEYGASVPAFTDAGNHTVYYKVTLANHNTVIDSFVVTIGKLAISYTALLDGEEDLTVTYDGNEHTLTAVVGNAQTSDLEVLDDVAITVSENGTKTAAGVYQATLTITGGRGANYKFAEEQDHVQWNIEVRSIVVTIANKTSVYGEEPVELTSEVTTGSIVDGDTNVYSIHCVVAITSSVNDYAITGTKGSNENYSVEFIEGTYSLTQREVTLTWALTDVDKDEISYVYDAAAHLPTATAGNLVGEDEVNVIVEGEQTNAGDYTATAVELDNGNYKLPEEVTHSFSITRAPLSVVADDKIATYGDEAPEYTATITGFVAEETAEVLGGQLGFSCVYRVSENDAGVYVIGVSGLTSDNYAISYTVGSLTVNPKAITVTYTSDHKVVAYGDMETWQDLGEEMEDNDYFISAEWEYEDDVWSSLEFSLNTEKDGSGVEPDLTGETFPNANKYWFIVEGDSDNYEFTINLGDEAYLLITPRQVTITAQNKASVYGDSIEELDATVVGGFANGDDDEDVYSLECKVDNVSISSTTGVGSYTISVIPANNPNYAVTAVSGVYQITPRPVSYTIEDKTSVYGDEIEQIGARWTAGTIVNNDTNIYTLSCSATAQSDVGTYAITGEGIDDNYNITFVNGLYTITARPVTITANNKTSVYGEAIVALDAEVVGGIVNDDAAADVYSLSCKSGNVAISSSTGVGAYTITVVPANNSNYDLTLVNATYRITARPITVTIANKTSVYGDPTLVLTAEVTTGSRVFGDTNVYALHCSATNTSNVGQYNITGERLDVNYSVTFVSPDGQSNHAIYTILQREVILTWSEATFVYDELTHTPTVTVSGTVNNDVVTATVVGGAINAGEHTATAIALSNENYKLPENVTFAFTITMPTSFDKTIDPAIIPEGGLDITGVFKNINTAEEGAELKVEIATSKVVFDKAAIGAIAGSNQTIKFSFSTKAGDDAKEVSKDAVFAFEITLDGATFENGTAEVTADFENKAPVGKVARLYYVDANGRRTNMNATFENGKVTFKTNHFSNYIVVYELSTITIVLIVFLVLILVAVAVLVVLYFILKKKGIDLLKFMKKNKENKPEAKAEEKKAETKEEAKEQPKEEVKEEAKVEEVDAKPKKAPKTEKEETPKKQPKAATAKKSGATKAKSSSTAKKK